MNSVVAWNLCGQRTNTLAQIRRSENLPSPPVKIDPVKCSGETNSRKFRRHSEWAWLVPWGVDGVSREKSFVGGPLKTTDLEGVCWRGGFIEWGGPARCDQFRAHPTQASLLVGEFNLKLHRDQEHADVPFKRAS